MRPSRLYQSKSTYIGMCIFRELATSTVKIKARRKRPPRLFTLIRVTVQHRPPHTYAHAHILFVLPSSSSETWSPRPRPEKKNPGAKMRETKKKKPTVCCPPMTSRIVKIFPESWPTTRSVPRRVIIADLYVMVRREEMEMYGSLVPCNA